ncbi:MAG TPA: hypothetical protein VGV09_02460 [Steroidobacteraceae bacterium]|nr:hypothetical protein [Steroidobacteraceae bacterium]
MSTETELDAFMHVEDAIDRMLEQLRQIQIQAMQLHTQLIREEVRHLRIFTQYHRTETTRVH